YFDKLEWFFRSEVTEGDRCRSLPGTADTNITKESRCDVDDRRRNDCRRPGKQAFENTATFQIGIFRHELLYFNTSGRFIMDVNSDRPKHSSSRYKDRSLLCQALFRNRKL